MGVSGSCRDWYGSERATVAIKGRYSAKEGVKKFTTFSSWVREGERMVPLVRFRTEVLPDGPIVPWYYESTEINQIMIEKGEAYSAVTISYTLVALSSVGRSANAPHMYRTRSYWAENGR